MSDVPRITDERLAEVLAFAKLCRGDSEYDDMISVATELQQLRFALAADRERVRSVVREAVEHWYRGNVSLDGVNIAEDIATRAAEQLATVRPVLTDDERKQLEHHIRDHRVTCSYSCSIIERLMNGAATEVGLSEEDRDELTAARNFVERHGGFQSTIDTIDKLLARNASK